MSAATGTNARVQARLELVERARQGREPTWILEEALADEELKVRERAAVVAAEMLAPDRLVALVANPSNLSGRAAAMVALRRAGARSLPALRQALGVGERQTAVFCLQVLGRIREADALEALREAAGSSDPLIVQTAIESLGFQRDRESLPLLIDALGREPWIAYAAVVALGELGDARAIAPLEALAARDPLLAESIEQAVSRIRATRRVDA